MAEDQLSFSSASSSVHQAPPPNRRQRNSQNKRRRPDDQEASSSRKPNRVRIFSEDDDLLILNGLVDLCNSNQRSGPLDKIEEFYPFLKQRLDRDFTRTQIKEKVRGLRESYFEKKKNARNLGGDGDEDGIVLESPHEAQVFELSKRVWDIGQNKDENGDDTDDGDEGKYVFLKEAPKIPETLGMPGILDKSMMLMKREDAKELNRCWKELRIEELGLYIHKLELLKETTEKILDAMKKD